MLIRFIKLSFFCFVLIFLISCQSDDEIVEKPAELLRIDSKIDLDQKWSKKVFSDISLGRPVSYTHLTLPTIAGV